MIDPASVVRTRLSNGLTVLIRRDRSAPVIAIVTYVSAGYFDETDDIVGIAHVLEHMYFKGTPTRGVGEIAKQTKAVGGYLNAATIYDHTSYYTVLPSSGFKQGLEVQADAYARSLIDADELARELEVIIQEAKRKADNPAAVATAASGGSPVPANHSPYFAPLPEPSIKTVVKAMALAVIESARR